MSAKKKSENKAKDKSCTLPGTVLQNDTDGETAVEIYMKNLAENPVLPVSVDFSDTQSLSTSGISILLGLGKQCDKEDRPLSFSGVSGELETLLKSFGLSDTLTHNKAGQ